MTQVPNYLVDVDNLIDYMLEIFYSGDGDATLSSAPGLRVWPRAFA